MSRATTLYLEAARLTLTASLLELASLAPDIRLNAIVCMGVVDSRALSEVGQGRAALGPAQQYSVCAGGRPKSELVEREALPPGGDDALPRVLCEG